MNFPERAAIVPDQGPETPIYAAVQLVSAKEAEGVFTITDVSIRVPSSYPVAPTTGAIRVDTGPLAGTFNVKQIRPNGHHVRYIATRLS